MNMLEGIVPPDPPKGRLWDRWTRRRLQWGAVIAALVVFAIIAALVVFAIIGAAVGGRSPKGAITNSPAAQSGVEAVAARSIQAGKDTSEVCRVVDSIAAGKVAYSNAEVISLVNQATSVEAEASALSSQATGMYNEMQTIANYLNGGQLAKGVEGLALVVTQPPCKGQ